MPKPTLTDGMKVTMQKRREAAQAHISLDYRHWYKRDVGILLKRIKELEDEA